MHIQYFILCTFRLHYDTMIALCLCLFHGAEGTLNLFRGMILVPLRYSAAGQASTGHYGVTLGPINNLEGQQLLEAAFGGLGGNALLHPFPVHLMLIRNLWVLEPCV